MEALGIPLKLIISLALGAVIGLEREVHEKRPSPGRLPSAILGVRSFSFMGLLGAISGLLFDNPQTLIFGVIVSVTFMVLLIVFYILESSAHKDFGITTELAAIFTFLIGALIAMEALPIQLILAISIFIVLMLSRKTEIKEAIKDVDRAEINAFIAYGVIALVILPFLPNKSYAFSDIPQITQILEALNINAGKLLTIEIINPFKLWLIVALITGIDMAGYVLERTLGKKTGWLLASTIGGFISSTATTLGLAQQSKQTRDTDHLVAAALFSNLASFFQIGILIAGVSVVFFVELIPVLTAIIIAGFLTGIYFLKFSKQKHESHQAVTPEKEDKVFQIFPAIKFAALFLVISIVSKIALVFLGNTGFLVTSGVASLVGLDAVMINTSTLAGKNIPMELALWTFVLVNTVNLGGKTVYSFLQGKRDFAYKFGISMGVIVIASLIGVFI